MEDDACWGVNRNWEVSVRRAMIEIGMTWGCIYCRERGFECQEVGEWSVGGIVEACVNEWDVDHEWGVLISCGERRF